MVPLSKSGLRFAERGFESHPLRSILRYCIDGKAILYIGKSLLITQ